ncbi:RNA helicase family protein [Actinidia rufa]|uniref:RNA helicase family protein n=1 Tax=Actinidia rufa TaxID=165716 RepID=A0A7J0DUD7_9ERIC|nr:RNA helicase family protein [Actinidia rufa]
MEAMVVVSMAGQTTVMAEEAKKVVVADKGRWVGWSSVEVESGGLRREKMSVNKACNYYQLGKTVHIDWKLAMEAMSVMGMAEQATVMAEEGRRVEVVVADKGCWGGWSSVGVEKGWLRREDDGWVIRMDAQNKVAAFALYGLFPDLHVHLLITEPHASIILCWNEGESSINLGDIEEDQRFGYVDSLLKAGSESVASVNALNGSIQEV